jgi:hypothetical protein
MHKEWIQDTRTEFLGASAALGDGEAIGLSINSTSVSDIEIRTRPGLPEGTFTARSYALGLSYSRRISDLVGIGATGKFLYEKILVDEASGFGLDMGLQYQTPIEHLSAGVVIANLGSMSALRTESTTLPSLIRVGGAYSDSLRTISSEFTVAADYQMVFPGSQSIVAIGGEIIFQQAFAARVGYTLGSEGRTFSAGIGVKYGIASLDYAFAPLTSELGNAHTFSFLINL